MPEKPLNLSELLSAEPGASQSRVNMLAERFRGTVLNSGIYSWMGLFTGIDSVGLTHLTVILKEREHDVRDGLNLSPSLVELALELRKAKVMLGLFYRRPGPESNLVESAQNVLSRQLGEENNNPSIQLLYEETFNVQEINPMSLPFDSF